MSNSFLLNRDAVGLTASFFGLGATLSNFLGQLVVEKFGHVASLLGSLGISVIPVILFAFLMPETLGRRGAGLEHRHSRSADENQAYIAIS